MKTAPGPEECCSSSKRPASPERALPQRRPGGRPHRLGGMGHRGLPGLQQLAARPFHQHDAASQGRRPHSDTGRGGGGGRAATLRPGVGHGRRHAALQRRGHQGASGGQGLLPIYEEAEKLGCCLTVHGGAHHHLGLDGFSVYYPVHALGHPFGIMVQAAAMLSHGIFERFPGLRVGFLEGGATWVPFFMDRLDRSYNEGTSRSISPETPCPGPGPTRRPASTSSVTCGREGSSSASIATTPGSPLPCSRPAPSPSCSPSDFPHEIFDAATCRHEIDELLKRDDLTQEQKEAVLGGNAARLYGIE